MGFTDTIRNGFQHYVTFSGRASRSEYWFWVLFVFVFSIVTGIIDGVLGIFLLNILFTLGTLLPSLAVSVRRMHDLGKRGWWLLVFLIPLVGPVIVLIWYCSRGTAGDNRFGPDPLAGQPEATAT